MKQMDGSVKRKPKEAFDTCHKCVQAVKNKEIYDRMRTQQLLNCLERVPKRKLRESQEKAIRLKEQSNRSSKLCKECQRQ